MSIDSIIEISLQRSRYGIFPLAFINDDRIGYDCWGNDDDGDSLPKAYMSRDRPVIFNIQYKGKLVQGSVKELKEEDGNIELTFTIIPEDVTQ